MAFRPDPHPHQAVRGRNQPIDPEIGDPVVAGKPGARQTGADCPVVRIPTGGTTIGAGVEAVGGAHGAAQIAIARRGVACAGRAVRDCVAEGTMRGAVHGAMHRPMHHTAVNRSVNHCPMDCSPAMRRARGVMRGPRSMTAAGVAAGMGVVFAMLFSKRRRCREQDKCERRCEKSFHHFIVVLCSVKLSQVSLVPAARALSDFAA